ncbi:hypothetical protein D3C87_1892070 [compost metagenome]
MEDADGRLVIFDHSQGDGLQRCGDVARRGGAAVLVVHDPEGRLTGGEAQHGLEEVGPVDAEHPGRAQHHRARVAGTDRQFAR